MKNGTVAGYRRNLTDALVSNCPGFCARFKKQDVARINGYLASLYVLRMEALPPAFVRSPEVEAIQSQIDLAIARIKDWLESKAA